ncbi:MAG: N,N-dimethylformamidase beta subunit family domain-containing protein [Thermoleophilaceae bacterium]
MSSTARATASSSALARVVFLVLVAATVGAFFVTQRLKRSGPVVKRLAMPLYISPNEDGRKDTARITFTLPKGDAVTVDVVDSKDDEVRRLLDDVRLRKGFHSLDWNGRNNFGVVPKDGSYYVRVTLRREGRAATGPRGMQLVTKPPRPRILSVTPRRLPLNGTRTPVTIRFTGPASPPPVYTVYRTDGGKVRKVATFTGVRSSHVARWNGLVNGKPAPEGTYAFAVTDENRALVAGSWPHRLPPKDKRAAPGTGITISGTTLSSPLEPVQAGAVVRVDVAGGPRRFRWSLARVGARKPIAKGTGGGAQIAFRLPARARTGLYVVTLRGGGRPASAPLGVRAQRSKGKVLVVLPAITWQGQNQVDENGNGFPDTLDGGEPVTVTRPFAFGRTPPGFAQTAALVRFLDSHGYRYDLTTDVALARGHGPVVAGHTGVLFPGSERWLTPTADAIVRAFVQGGGRVASFGTDAFRREVRLTGAKLAGPTPPRPINALGEGTGALRIPPAPLVVSTDRLGLFGGTDGFVGLFTDFEQETSLPRGARLLAGAGRDPKKPAFVAYSLGRGTVIRVGTPAWTSSIDSDAQVARVTQRIWALLSR